MWRVGGRKEESRTDCERKEQYTIRVLEGDELAIDKARVG